MILTTHRKLRDAWPDPVKMTYAQREILKAKPQFYEWYRMIYQYIVNHLAPGDKNVEIGSGSSFLSEFIPGLIKTNILHIRFNDITCNGYNLPFKDGMIDNIVLIDVLHHLDSPFSFFEEARRVLKEKGRIIICDPYISFFSYLIWKHIHPENCDMRRLGYALGDKHNPLISANSASLTLLFVKKNDSFAKRFPELKVLHKDYHTIMYYWLAGGYNFSSLVPLKMISLVKRLEKILSFSGYYLASFLFVVIEKNG